MKITSVEVRAEMIDISSSEYDPDPNWVFVDALGKEHRWVYAANHKWHLPTLKRRTICENSDEKECSASEAPCSGAACEGCELYDIVRYEREEWYIQKTGEVVEPRYRRATPQYIRGPMSYDGMYESDERPEVGGTYKLEDCEILSADKTLYGDIFIISAEFEEGGVWHGAWRGVGEVTESARVTST